MFSGFPAKIYLVNPKRSELWGRKVYPSFAAIPEPVDLALTVIPTSAVQTIDNEKVVFVRTPEGFERHPVGLGRNDDRLVEVVTGLRSGEVIAVTNTFSLKAELMKALAED